MKEIEKQVTNIISTKTPIDEISITLLNILNHHTYYSNPAVWKDIIARDAPYDTNSVNTEYKFYVGFHEYRYYSCFEHSNGNVFFSFSFSIDGSEACEKDFVQILTLFEKEIESI